MMSPLVYDYDEPSAYLRDVLAFKKRRHPLFSLRAWSKQMGFRGHASLVFLLNGQRKIRPEHLPNIERGLNLQGDEANYWRALVSARAAATESEREHFESRLKVLKPERADVHLDVERFRLVADWIHMAILEMTCLKDFRSQADWIARRMKFKVSVSQVEDAIERLCALGLLARAENGTLTKTNERLSTPRDRAGECIREHHQQVLTNAIQAVHAQTVDERVYNSCAMTVDASKLNEAKELILKFRADMAKLMEKPAGDETYQLSVQFFKLTDSAQDKGVHS